MKNTPSGTISAFAANSCAKRLAALCVLIAAPLLLSSCALNSSAVQPMPVPVESLTTIEPIHAAPGTPQDYVREAMELQAAGKNGSTKLLDLKNDFKGTPWALRASFMLANISLEKKYFADARRQLNDALGLKDAGDYILLSLARTKRMLGDNKAALEACDMLTELYPDSPLVPEALYEKAVAQSEAMNIAGAIRTVSGLIDAYPRSNLTPDALLKYAEWSWKLQRADDALGAIRRIQVNYPADAAAVEADKVLISVKNASKRPQPLTAEEIITRGQKFSAAARYNDAIKEFSSALKGSDAQTRCRLANFLGQAQIKLRRYGAAQKSLRVFLDGKTACGNAPDALYWLALADLRLGRLEELARVERRLEAEFPDSNARAKVLTLLASFYEDNNDYRSALKIYRLVIGKWPGSPVAEQAYWRAGWIEYTSGRYLNAYRDFTAYAMAPNAVGTTRFLYWSGRAAERAGDLEAASTAYANVCSSDAGSFYCLLASGRAVAKAVTITAISTAKPPGIPSADNGLLEGSRYPVAMELLNLGMNSRAASEIELLMERYRDDGRAMNALAGLYAATGEYGRALDAWKKYFKRPAHEPETDELTIPEIAFPSAIVDIVKKTTADDSIDPYLVAAVMREESSFNPAAVSPAGALGLLQVMPKTGKFAAKNLGIKNFERVQLFKPGINIKIGAWYLGYLALKFNNDLVLTVASYNAGPAAAAKWLKTLPHETDEFIEAIPYKETRFYVMRVISSYAQYLRLSGISPEGLLLQPMISRSINPSIWPRKAAALSAAPSLEIAPIEHENDAASNAGRPAI